MFYVTIAIIFETTDNGMLKEGNKINSNKNKNWKFMHNYVFETLHVFRFVQLVLLRNFYFLHVLKVKQTYG